MGVPGRIGDIQPFAELFEGATTVVYKGYQEALDRYVLLKVLKPAFSGDDDLAHRFEAEARLLAKVEHPNVVAIYTYGRAEGRSYLATEFVEGFSLRALLHRGTLPYPLVLYILHAASKGLQAIHDQGILHRDIKPENILVGQEGQVKLTDFGLASLVDDAEAEVRGTLAYLAPEQVLGEPPTVSSDLFSLGATCYEMLVGRPAFSSRDASGYLDAVLHHDPLPFLASDTGLPPPVLRLTSRLMAKRPEDRYPSVAALHADLEATRQAGGQFPGAPDLALFLQDPDTFRIIKPAPAVPPRSSQRAPWPGRMVAALLGIFLVALVGYAGFTEVAGPEPSLPASVSTAPPPSSAGVGVQGADDSSVDSAFSSVVLGDPEAETGAQPEAAEAGAGLDPVAADGNRSLAPSEALREEQPRDEGDIERGRPQRGALRVMADPWAVVVIDGDSVDLTPLAEPVVLAPGTYRLELLNPAFPPYETTVDVAAGDTIEHRVTFWDRVGLLSLEVSPWAEVLIDAVVRDTVPPQKRPFVVAPGLHDLRLRHPVLGAIDTTIQVAAGDTLRLRFNLDTPRE